MSTSFVSRVSGALCAAFALAIAASAVPAAAAVTLVPPPANRPDLTFRDHPQWVAGYGIERLQNVDAARILRDSATSQTLPYWAGMFTDGSTPYTFLMAGKNPYAKNAGATKINFHVFAYVLKFAGGSVFDPRAVDSNCDSVSPLGRFFKSPLFNSAPITSNGVNLGNIQYEDAHEKGEWYAQVKKDPNYALNLTHGSVYNWQNLTVPASEGGAVASQYTCHGAYGLVSSSWLENEFLALSTGSKFWNPDEVPTILLYNVFEVDDSGHCCILGYHSAYTNSAGHLQPFAVITVNDAGILSNDNIQDVHAASHELGEFINDPTTANTVPTWGHVGQTSGCQTNLEVGDPLTGTLFNGTGINLGGFVYHVQELAFFNWFTQSTGYGYLGTGGKYSMSGTFSSPAAPCT